MVYRILSFDGGGIRGVITARILERIVGQRGDFVSKSDLLAGSSTGAIVALGLAKGCTPADLVRLYKEKGPTIFHDTFFHDVEDAWGILSAKYSTQNRYDGLYPTLQETTLEQLPQKVLISSFDLDSAQELGDPGPRRWKAKFFHNYPGDDSDGDQRAIDVAMRSSAAPTYFPIYQGYVDGGVVANNPSVCALAQALRNPDGGQQDLKDVVLCSIGTGDKPEYELSRDGDWGLTQWGFKIINLMFDADGGLADFQCSQLLRERYFRLDVQLPDPIDIDTYKRVQEMITLADNLDLSKALAWIDTNWK